MAQITLTAYTNGESFTLEDTQIVYVNPYSINDVVVGAEVTITDTAGVNNNPIYVSETAVEVAALTTALLQITLTGGTTPYIAIERVKNIVTNGSVADIHYDNNGQVLQVLKTSMTIAAILAAIETGSNSPKVYRALLSQVGTAIPTAVILENSLGFTPTFTYDEAGAYNIVAPSGEFIEAKCDYRITPNDNSINSAFLLSLFNGAPNSFKIETRASGTLSDEILYNTPVLILIYP